MAPACSQATECSAKKEKATAMVDQSRERAVVLGGGIAGLLAARVLSDAYTDVVVVDRDQLTGTTGFRNGVPHGRHAHCLVARGQQIFEELLPGVTQEMSEAGVTLGDFNGQIQWHFNGQKLAASESDLICVSSGRPILEEHVRKHVQAIPNVRFLERYDIVGLETTPEATRVTGARIQRSEPGSQPEVLLADLVVDITGRGSRMPAWLGELGYQAPPEDKIKVDLAYTTRHYKFKTNPFTTDIAINQAGTPAFPRGVFCYLLPDGETVELSLTGVLGDHAPTDPEGFTDYIKSLPLPNHYEYVHDAEPVDDPVRFKFPASVWRHYEQLTRFPDGLLVMGDAVCSFNPVYAQGMTVAGMEALTLQKHLQGPAGVNAIPFFGEIAGQIAGPWQFSAIADLGYPGVEGERTDQVRLINQYIPAVLAAAAHDPVVTNAFLQVAGLVADPMSLMHPDIAVRVGRVLQQAGRQAASTPPATAPLTPARN
jgi:2-polyprenyl-6-methoxyphenol hydroxylase-like FAD-dependent oxidoreductase